MNKNKLKLKVILKFILIFLGVIFILGFVLKKSMYCPDILIENYMPKTCIGGDCNSSNKSNDYYYIKNGDRKESSEYNYWWSKYICGVKTEKVE